MKRIIGKSDWIASTCTCIDTNVENAWQKSTEQHGFLFLHFLSFIVFGFFIFSSRIILRKFRVFLPRVDTYACGALHITLNTGPIESINATPKLKTIPSVCFSNTFICSYIVWLVLQFCILFSVFHSLYNSVSIDRHIPCANEFSFLAAFFGFFFFEYFISQIDNVHQFIIPQISINMLICHFGSMPDDR